MIRFIGIALIPIGAALFYNQYVIQDLGLRQSMVSMVAALIGMIPEGLFLLTSVALALSVVRLAQNKTLIHEMNAVETLARVDVLCVDKTGTVTLPEMELREVLPLDEAACPKAEIEDTLGAFYRSLEADNDTARAIQKRYPSGPYRSVKRTVPFTSATKWSAVDFGEDGCFAIGAPEYLLGDDVRPLEEKLHYFASQGCRVLLLAQCDGAEEGKLLGVVIPLALLVLENPVRPSAPKTFDYFRAQGVAVKVISGDNPVTVSAVAQQAGIEGGGKLGGCPGAEDRPGHRPGRAGATPSSAGWCPIRSARSSGPCRAQGHTVAMTGDGVNDVLALKDADCGIAMASGAESRLPGGPAGAAGQRLRRHAQGGGGGPPGHQQHPAGLGPVPREEHPLLLPGHHHALCGLPLSLRSHPADADLRPHHRRAVLLPGPGAQPRPGAGQVPAQRASAAPSPGDSPPSS